MKKKLGMICLLLAMALPVSALACDHNFGPWKTKTSATCTRQAHQFRYCQKCDHWEQRRTAKLPHTPGEMTVTKEPTCTEIGKQQAICQVCGRLVRYNIDKLEHAYGEMTVLSEPTCKNAGKGQYVCADCGGKKTVKLDKLEHVYGEWVIEREPEGKRMGLRSAVCTLCGGEREERFFWEGTLYEGMPRCEEVIHMQEKLRDLGYYRGVIRTGQFGDLTTSAVAKFQKANGLDDTGIADSATLDCLNSAWEQATGKSAEPALDEQEMENAQDAQSIAG